MATAIHIEINALFLLILCVISWQINHSVSKQMTRILFRYVVLGDMFILGLDILWMLVEGRSFPGAITLNGIINGIYLGAVVIMGGVWYLYVLENLGFTLTRKLVLLVLSPGFLFAILNLISIKTGWIFYINKDNYYMRGPLFPLQTAVALLELFVSMFHLIIFYFTPQTKIAKQDILRLMVFYVVPFVGTLLSLPISGMPGTWTCAAVSIILIYMNDQENAILRDSLTGLNNRKTLEPTFDAYIHQTDNAKNLYLFMLDLNNFKGINDTYGHPVGDKALVEASNIIKNSMRGQQGIVVRYGGDEFAVLTFLNGNTEAVSYEKQLKADFAKWNVEHDEPYELSTCIGWTRYQEGETLKDMLTQADKKLYQEKSIKKVGR